MDSDVLSRCWFLAGPTACGKTALSLEIAERIGAEIVALDSMTVYRGMDIGTAKATVAEQSRVPHHMIDVIEPHEEFSLAEYLAMAEDCCRKILIRGRIPLFVGGTGLYLRSALRGVFEGPEADWALRQDLEAKAANEGPESLHRELAEIDPVTAARLHPNDIRRVIRAIEVHRLTGTPLSQLQLQPPRPITERTPHVYWLNPPRDWLYDRINARVEQMFADGLVNEVLRLRNMQRPVSHTARQGLGYKEVFDWLDQCDDPNSVPQRLLIPPRFLIELIQTRTRQFAKRQLTWFRNMEECVAVEFQGTESTASLANLVASQC